MARTEPTWRAWLWLFVTIALPGAGSTLARLMARAVHPAGGPHHWSAAPDSDAISLTMPVPFIDGSFMNGAPTVVAVVIVTTIATCLAAYRLALTLRARGWSEAPAILTAQAAALLSLSTFSVTLNPDPYYYVYIGRLVGIFHLNPYHVFTTLDFRDPISAKLFRLYGFPTLPDNYGPLWTLLVGAIAYLQLHASLALQYWSQRLIAVIAAVLLTLAVLRILKGHPDALRRVNAMAFHPLMALETAVNGHNDVVMVMFSVWAFVFVDANPLIAACFLGASIAVKYLSIVLVPFVLVRAFRRGLKTGTACGAIVIAVPLAAIAPFWFGPRTLAGLVGQSGEVAASPAWLLSYPLYASGRASAKVFPYLSHTPYLKSLTWPAVIDLLLLAIFVAIAAISIKRYATTDNVVNIWRTITAFFLAIPVIGAHYCIWLAPMIVARGLWGTYAWWLLAFALLSYVIPNLGAYTVLFVVGPIFMTFAVHGRRLKARLDRTRQPAGVGHPFP